MNHLALADRIADLEQNVKQLLHTQAQIVVFLQNLQAAAEMRAQKQAEEEQ